MDSFYQLEESIKRIKNQEYKDKFQKLSENVYYTQYAFGTLNTLIQIEDKEEFKKFYKEDLKDGRWTIDLVSSVSNVDEYFKDYTIDELKEEMIDYVLDWEENEQYENNQDLESI